MTRRHALGTLAVRADGFSLLEVMIALGVLGFGLLTLAVMQLEALSQGSAGRHTSDAAAVGRTHLEQVMRLPWTELDVAQAIGTFTNPSWAGAGPTVNMSVAMPAGLGAAIEHTYNVQWRVTDVGGNPCLRDVEVRVNWAEETVGTKSMDLATRRYNWGDPSC